VINWYSLLFNTFWVVGLAILLAAFSYQYWEARQTQTRLRVQFSQPSFLLFFWLSFGFVSIGLAGTATRIWEILIWGVFAVIGFFFMTKAIVSR
jgi:hypothetical protein